MTLVCLDVRGIVVGTAEQLATVYDAGRWYAEVLLADGRRVLWPLADTTRVRACAWL